MIISCSLSEEGIYKRRETWKNLVNILDYQSVGIIERNAVA